MGRPPIYDDVKTVAKAEEYLQTCIDEEYSRIKSEGDKSVSYDNHVRVKLPSIEGLSLFLDVTRDTVHEWKKIHPNFSYIVNKILAEQAKRLIEGGMSGVYNASIAKLLLTKHGYVDKVEEKQELSGGLTIGWANPKSDE